MRSTLLRILRNGVLSIVLGCGGAPVEVSIEPSVVGKALRTGLVGRTTAFVPTTSQALQLLNVIGVAVEQQIFRSLFAGILHDRHQVLRPVVVLGLLVAMEEIFSIAGDHGAVPMRSSLNPETKRASSRITWFSKSAVSFFRCPAENTRNFLISGIRVPPLPELAI